MDKLNISFIGAGNMASSLIGGLLADGKTPASINIADVNSEQLTKLQNRYAITVCQSNSEAAETADILILAVKPQSLRAVAEEIRDSVQNKQLLVISIAAGVREQDINRWLGNDVAIVRAMPVGIALWIKTEQQMDAVTALSGSGPAYFFLFMEAMETAARELGLDAEAARLLTLQTAFGATKMALESSDECATLRQRVTSPGGTTERALSTFEAGNLRQLVKQAITDAAKRSEELAQQLGGVPS